MTYDVLDETAWLDAATLKAIGSEVDIARATRTACLEGRCRYGGGYAVSSDGRPVLRVAGDADARAGGFCLGQRPWLHFADAGVPGVLRYGDCERLTAWYAARRTAQGASGSPTIRRGRLSEALDP